MNSGLVASRYATAFLEYVTERGVADAVYEQVRVILSVMGRLPQLCSVLTDSHSISLDRKKSLISSVLGDERPMDEIFDLLSLLQRNERVGSFRMVLLDFLDLYRKKKGIVMVQLTTATAQDDFVPAFRKMEELYQGKTLVVNHKVNPDILGGFVYETWGWRIDASLRRSLEEIKEELIEKNRRLV